jgi:hypothetical protein
LINSISLLVKFLILFSPAISRYLVFYNSLSHGYNSKSILFLIIFNYFFCNEKGGG